MAVEIKFQLESGLVRQDHFRRRPESHTPLCRRRGRTVARRGYARKSGRSERLRCACAHARPSHHSAHRRVRAYGRASPTVTCSCSSRARRSVRRARRPRRPPQVSNRRGSRRALRFELSPRAGHHLFPYEAHHDRSHHIFRYVGQAGYYPISCRCTPPHCSCGWRSSIFVLWNSWHGRTEFQAPRRNQR